MIYKRSCLFQSTVLVEEMIQDLKGLMQSLPVYASNFMEMICAILNNYKETCYAAYKSKITFSFYVLECGAVI